MKQFFHASRDIKFLRSFLREGAKAIGKGVGGQKTGFYVYENKKNTLSHIQFLDRQKKILSSKGGLIVGVKVEEKSEITVPKYTGTRQYEYLQIAE